MSRRIGPRHRQLLDVLFEYEGWAIETTEVKSLVGGDRSNVRRAVRGLLWWVMVHEWLEGHRHYYELDLLDWILAVPLRPDDPAKRPPGWAPPL